MEQNIEAFYKSVAQSPAALQQLTAGVQTPDEFIDRAVTVGQEQGYSFTRAEASTWINGQIEARKNGELSDVQLEGVAGGKGINSAINSGLNSIPGVTSATNTINSGINTAGNAVIGAANTVGNWFSSW
jgi:hypothetical protein